MTDPALSDTYLVMPVLDQVSASSAVIVGPLAVQILPMALLALLIGGTLIGM